MAFKEADVPSIVQTELDSIFFQSFNKPNAQAGYQWANADTERIFQKRYTDLPVFIGAQYSGTGLWKNIGEVTKVPQSNPVIDNKYTIIVSDWADGIEISKNLYDDALFNVWQNAVRDFGRMARITMDVNAFGVFRTATSTTLTPDGVSLGNAAHPLTGGVGTQSNIVAGPLTRASLAAAMQLMAQFKNTKGVVMGNTGTTLLVPLAEYDNALEITGSTLVSDSANNTMNVFRSVYGITVMTSPYLGAAQGGSDTNCFLLAEDTHVIRVIRQGVETALTPWQNSRNRTYFYQGNFRETIFAEDWSGVVVIGS